MKRLSMILAVCVLSAGAAHAAEDPKEREQLMNQHMKTMEESMAKMGGMMGCGKM